MQKENTGRYKERMRNEDARANKRKKGEKISRGKRKMQKRTRNEVLMSGFKSSMNRNMHTQKRLASLARV